jgi:hypothetical protein
LAALSHNYPIANALRVVDQSGDPIEDATVRVFSAIQYAAGDFDTWLGETTTDENGDWKAPIEASAGSWVIYIFKSNAYGPTTVAVVVAEPTPPEEPEVPAGP